MKIAQAIEILTFYLDDLDKWNEADTDGAIKLGMEALKVILSIRRAYKSDLWALLPGETKE